MPLYRKLEAERLLEDVQSEDYITVVTRRQHVYDQLNGLLREAGMSAEEMTVLMLEGLFDQHNIAGVPVFRSPSGDRFVLLNYSYSGFDEHHPEGTDFSGSYSLRSNLGELLAHAEELGYATHHETSGVSGGTHQHWDWYGVRIDDYDSAELQNNVPKVQKILRDLGIEPKEAISSLDPSSTHDLYLRDTQ